MSRVKMSQGQHYIQRTQHNARTETYGAMANKSNDKICCQNEPISEKSALRKNKLNRENILGSQKNDHMF